MIEVQKTCVSFMFSIPQNLVKCHSFAAQSLFDWGREKNMETAFSDDTGYPTGYTDDNVQLPINVVADTTPGNYDTEVAQTWHVRTNTHSTTWSFIGDRDEDFITIDGGKLGHAIFDSIHTEKIPGSDYHSYAVREPAGDKYWNIVWFTHNMSDHIQDLLKTWVASPKCFQASHLFAGSYFGCDTDFILTVDSDLHDNAIGMTHTQRSAGLSILRQLIMIASTCAKLLKRKDSFRELTRTTGYLVTAVTSQEELPIMVDIWFSRERSSEKIKRGNRNEE